MKDRVVAENRKARHEYFIIESLEVGIQLTGTEIKSIRAGKVNMTDSYAQISNGETWLHNMHIAEYEHGNRYNHEPKRSRKLLIHKKEIKKFSDIIKQQGLTLIPLKLYFKGNWLKCELGLCKGKKLYDKRESLKNKETNREIERALKR